jgi:hypothetical protein
MVDIDAAIGFVVARGDAVDRARLSWLRAGIRPPDDVLTDVEIGHTAAGGWPAQWGVDVPSIDATCFRLTEIDDLGGLARPVAGRAIDWLANRQRADGYWEEDPALADVAPKWAMPGDPEARFYLTTNAGFWLAVAAGDSGYAGLPAAYASTVDSYSGVEQPAYADALGRAAQAIREALHPDGAWPGYLVSGWLAAAVLHRTGWFYESARIFAILGERVPDMTAADTAWMAASLRRVGVSAEDPLLAAARRRLDQTQRSDGAWPSDDATTFDVHTTLTGIRAVRQ